MATKLVSVENGILGFEMITSWDVVESTPEYLHIREATPNLSNSNKVKFFLINSLAACQKYLKKFPNAEENNWYVLTVPNSGTPTMNTKAPVVISGHEIQQIVTSSGSVLTPCE